MSFSLRNKKSPVKDTLLGEKKKKRVIKMNFPSFVNEFWQKMRTRSKTPIACVCQESVLPGGQDNDLQLENAAQSTLLEKKTGIPAFQIPPGWTETRSVHGLQFDTIVQ